MSNNRLIVLSGAGISQESGLATFRDHGGLWEGHNVQDVATPEAWKKNPQLVLDFYNQRRKNLDAAKPNKAHEILVRLEQHYSVQIITQNVDDLHERAGSTDILHLHGELRKCRSDQNPNLIYDYTVDLKIGDLAEDGTQLRPHVVWFGEAVPNIEKATTACAKADVIIIVGTSLSVYPAANLYHYAPDTATIYYIDPQPNYSVIPASVHVIPEKASTGLDIIYSELTNQKLQD